MTDTTPRPVAANFRFVVDGLVPDLPPLFAYRFRPVLVVVGWSDDRDAARSQATRRWHVQIEADNALVPVPPRRHVRTWNSDTYRDLDGTTGALPGWALELVEPTRAAADLVLGPPPAVLVGAPDWAPTAAELAMVVDKLALIRQILRMPPLTAAQAHDPAAVEHAVRETADTMRPIVEQLVRILSAASAHAIATVHAVWEVLRPIAEQHEAERRRQQARAAYLSDHASITITSGPPRSTEHLSARGQAELLEDRRRAEREITVHGDATGPMITGDGNRVQW